MPLCSRPARCWLLGTMGWWPGMCRLLVRFILGLPSGRDHWTSAGPRRGTVCSYTMRRAGCGSRLTTERNRLGPPKQPVRVPHWFTMGRDTLAHREAGSPVAQWDLRGCPTKSAVDPPELTVPVPPVRRRPPQRLRSGCPPIRPTASSTGPVPPPPRPCLGPSAPRTAGRSTMPKAVAGPTNRSTSPPSACPPASTSSKSGPPKATAGRPRSFSPLNFPSFPTFPRPIARTSRTFPA